MSRNELAELEAIAQIELAYESELDAIMSLYEGEGYDLEEFDPNELWEEFE